MQASLVDMNYSNIRHPDYVGPEACGECHERQYQLWRDHPHSTMNANASVDTVLGDFSGVRLPYANGHVEFSHDEQFTMTFFRDGQRERRFKITRTIGSKYIQEYVGVQTEGPEPLDHKVYSLEQRMPFGYWFVLKQWFPKVYYDAHFVAEYKPDGKLSFDPYTPEMKAWDEHCIFCHNTYAYDVRAERRKNLIGFPRGDLSLDKAGPLAATKNNLETEELVTVGISCESCHFGGREHTRREKEIRFFPSDPDLKYRRGTPEPKTAREDPYVVNSICNQCHSSNPWKYPNGASMWNSNEAGDMANGVCASQIKCTDCHNPHLRGPLSGGPDRSDHIDACLGCHEEYRSSEYQLAHSRHPVDAGVSCLDCHMPRLVQGLSDFVRSHSISSPSDIRMLASGAPNACNLCHLDKSVLWTLHQLKAGWGRTLVPDKRWNRGYGGNLKQALGSKWLRDQLGMVRAVAATAYSRTKHGKTQLHDLLGLLNDPVAFLRMRILLAIQRVLGRSLRPDEFSPMAAPDVRIEQMTRLFETLVD